MNIKHIKNNIPTDYDDVMEKDMEGHMWLEISKSGYWSVALWEKLRYKIKETNSKQDGGGMFENEEGLEMHSHFIKCSNLEIAQNLKQFVEILTKDIFFDIKCTIRNEIQQKEYFV